MDVGGLRFLIIAHLFGLPCGAIHLLNSLLNDSRGPSSVLGSEDPAVNSRTEFSVLIEFTF